MAAVMSTNPFESEPEVPNSSTSSRSTKVNYSSSSITYEDVANKLLKDNFLLTALELYTELAESGRESHKLRDYFSNPSNFERNTQVKQDLSTNLERTASVTTFDSLDFARYSDDGDRQCDERVAVLEFELRKAKDTIKSLRANLTEATESDPNTPERDTGRRRESVSDPDNQPLKPHELRALNFLVNEYLLKHNYKLTSITFSDENENQDFEDWDDVGLNISKPPDILQLYRDYGRHHQVASSTNYCDVAVQTEEMETVSTPSMEEELVDVKSQLKSIAEENQILKEKMKNLERDLENTVAQQIKSSTPAVTPICTPRKSQAVAPFSINNKQSSSNIVEYHSELNADELKMNNDDLNQQLLNIPSASSNQSVSSSLNVERNSIADMSVTIESLSSNSSKTAVPTESSEIKNRAIPEEYRKHLDEIYYQRKPLQDPRLSAEVSQIVDSHDKVVFMLARCLPHIIPNVILAKREELIPVILGTISMHPDANERDNLLHLLFNLIKRPGSEQRQVILSGFVSIACRLGPTRVEAELLPQCWEQLNHKYVERRLLVAESCGVLAPHLPVEIRNSLVISMLQQMLMEEKVDEVRVAAVRSLAMLYLLVDDTDKISQGLGLITQGLMDSSEAVIDSVMTTFLPVMALWLLQLNKLQENLVMFILQKLYNVVTTRQRAISSSSMSSVMPSSEERKVSVLICCLQSLVPYLFVSVVSTGPYSDDKGVLSPAILELNRFPRVSDDPLHNPAIIYGDKLHLEKLLYLYDEHVGQEWYESWDQLDWLHKIFLPEVVNLLCSSQVSSMPNVVPSLTLLMSTICRAFGRSYTITRIIPLFQQAVTVADDELAQVQSGDTALTQQIVPVYAGGVLAVFSQEEDRTELQKFLSSVLTTLSLCNLSIQSLQTTFAQLCEHPSLHELLLSVLWDGVMHTSTAVRASSAKLFQLLIVAVSQTLLANRVIPALVTFATDSDMSVRTAVVEAFGIVLQTATNNDILDKVKMQFQTFLDDAVLRDHHPLHLELIHTFANISPNLEPSFREEFVLPRLAALASRNNNSTNDTRRMNIALGLLEAYTALSCCPFNNGLIIQSVIPGLQCLLNDVRSVAPEHENAVLSMIREFEIKTEVMRPVERSSGGATSSLQQLSASGMEDMKNKMTKYFSQHRPTSRPNISNIFQIKKK